MTLEQVVDKLGKVRDQIALLQAEEEQLRQQLLEADIATLQGKRFRMVVTHSEYPRIDYKGLVEHLKPSKRILNLYTKTEQRVQVRTTPLRGNRVQE